MKTRNFFPTDLNQINEWLLMRDMAPIDLEDLPRHGWVVLGEGKKISGVVFVRLCEGGYGIMDSMANDPELPSEVRHKVNERLFFRVKRFAVANELKGVFGTTVDKGTLERGLKHGFVASSQTLCVWRNEEVM